MTRLTCNNCGTTQSAKVFRASIPFNIVGGAELQDFYLIVIDKCEKCNQKKVYAVGFNHLGFLLNYGYLKTKQCKVAEKRIIAEVGHLPRVQNNEQKGGFYLYYGEYGKKKRCYSNLSTLKLGFTGGDLDQLRQVSRYAV